VPIALRVELNRGVITFEFPRHGEVGRRVVEKDFSSATTGLPSIHDGHFEFVPVAASIGDLPIHPAIRRHRADAKLFPTVVNKLKARKNCWIN